MTGWRMWSEPGWFATDITAEDAQIWWRRSRDPIDTDMSHLRLLDGDLKEGLFRVASYLPGTGIPGVRNLVVTLAEVDRFHVPPEGERDPESAAEVLWNRPVPRETTTKEIQQ